MDLRQQIGKSVTQSGELRLKIVWAVGGKIEPVINNLCLWVITSIQVGEVFKHIRERRTSTRQQQEATSVVYSSNPLYSMIFIQICVHSFLLSLSSKTPKNDEFHQDKGGVGGGHPKAAEAKTILDECIVSKVTHLVCGDLQKGSLYV